MTIEGIPAGWELVRFGYANKGESFLNGRGEIILHVYDTPSPRKRLIIRKIEKPKQYSPFANAVEADDLWNAVLKPKNPKPEEEGVRYRVNVLGPCRVGIGLLLYTYEEAFAEFECVDGTPFGIKLQS